MKVRYGNREVDWLCIVGAVLVIGSTAALLALMGRPM